MLDLAMPMLAQAAVAVQPAGATINLTEVAVAIVSGTFTVLSIVLPLWISSHVKDRNAAQTVNNAIAHSLGAVQNAAEEGIKSHPLLVQLPGVSATTAAGVQYVLDHAGAEMARNGDTLPAIADKIDARLGLVKLHADATAQANVAAAASVPPPPPPLVDAAGLAIPPVPPTPSVVLIEGTTKGA